MNLLTKTLIGMLIISGIMPMMASLFATFNQPMLMQMMNLQTVSTPEIQKALLLLGAAMIPCSAIQFIAAAWIWKGKPQGVTLAIWVGILISAIGFYLTATMGIYNISDPMLGAMDIFKGIIITVLSYAVSGKKEKAVNAAA
jgi:hypothetical protein